MNLDDLVKQAGITATIIRSAGNVNTYLYINPKVKNTSFNTMPFEREAIFPTAAAVAEGDLVSAGGDYYLVIGVIKDQRVNEYWLDRARLFRCNNTISVKTFNPTTKLFAVSLTGIHCLLVSQSDRMRIATDRGIVLQSDKGQDADYGLFVQSVTDIKKGDHLIDENGYPLSVCANISPYFVKGLLDIPVRIDRK